MKIVRNEATTLYRQLMLWKGPRKPARDRPTDCNDVQLGHSALQLQPLRLPSRFFIHGPRLVLCERFTKGGRYVFFGCAPAPGTAMPTTLQVSLL